MVNIPTRSNFSKNLKIGKNKVPFNQNHHYSPVNVYAWPVIRPLSIFPSIPPSIEQHIKDCLSWAFIINWTAEIFLLFYGERKIYPEHVTRWRRFFSKILTKIFRQLKICASRYFGQMSEILNFLNVFSNSPFCPKFTVRNFNVQYYFVISPP